MANYKIKEYRGIHNWVERRLGKPSLCVVCNDSSKSKYHWANISGEYRKDLGDWRRLCVKCHMNENNPYTCINGHEKTANNRRTTVRRTVNAKIYIKEYCLLCQREYDRRYKHSKVKLL